VKKVLPVLLAIVLLGLTACSQSVSAEVLQSEKPRNTKPRVSQNEMATLVDGNSEFAFDLYQVLKEGGGNLFYSPYSISVALAMTISGARGETEGQMADTLNFTLPQDSIHPVFNGLDMDLNSRGKGARGKDGGAFRLNIVNAMWGQKDLEFLPEFLDVLSENYGSGLRILDFAAEPEPSRITINDWVSKQTKGRINDLVPPGIIDSKTGIILTNAIYFNAAWKFRFNENPKSDGTFELLDGTKVKAQMMRREEKYGQTWGINYQAIELPYDGDELSMVILLPARGQFEEFENSMDYETVNGIISDIKESKVSLEMPKFNFKSEFDLKDVLAEMGMPIAFSQNADFSGMTSARRLYIAEIMHKGFIAVDKSGTEAAAATFMMARFVGRTPSITVDRPFIFLIRDIETGTILFMGRVLNPNV